MSVYSESGEIHVETKYAATNRPVSQASDRHFFWHFKIAVELNAKMYFCFPIQFIAYNNMTFGHESTLFSGKSLWGFSFIIG